MVALVILMDLVVLGVRDLEVHPLMVGVLREVTLVRQETVRLWVWGDLPLDIIGVNGTVDHLDIMTMVPQQTMMDPLTTMMIKTRTTSI